MKISAAEYAIVQQRLLDAGLTHVDPDVRMRTRLLATGILDTLRQWCRDEKDRPGGASAVDILENAMVVLNGEIGILIRDALRPDTPMVIIHDALSKYSNTAIKVLAIGLGCQVEVEVETKEKKHVATGQGPEG